MSRLFLAVACLTLAACKRAPETPRFCPQDLSGVWLNSTDKHFAYQLRDDGGVVTGEFKERSDDGGLSSPGEPITFELKRTQSELAGMMRSTGETESGKKCPVEFETRISDCKPEALQVVVETSAPMAEDCKRGVPPDGGQFQRDLREYRLERAPR
jgi:hypothetical protein